MGTRCSAARPRRAAAQAAALPDARRRAPEPRQVQAVRPLQPACDRRGVRLRCDNDIVLGDAAAAPVPTTLLALTPARPSAARRRQRRAADAPATGCAAGVVAVRARPSLRPQRPSPPPRVDHRNHFLPATVAPSPLRISTRTPAAGAATRARPCRSRHRPDSRPPDALARPRCQLTSVASATDSATAEP